LLYSWVISPIRYVDTEPASLRADFREQYRALIAAAFLSNGDLPRAKARLALLADPDIGKTIAIQAQLAQDRAGPDTEKNGLAALAAALNSGLISITPMVLPSASPTLEPSSTLTPTPVVALGEPPIQLLARLNLTLAPTTTASFAHPLQPQEPHLHSWNRAWYAIL
jgi:hypothetical protein